MNEEEEEHIKRKAQLKAHVILLYEHMLTCNDENLKLKYLKGIDKLLDELSTVLKK